MQYRRADSKWALVVFCFYAAEASGYAFLPTDLEFAAWPEYCRARYVETNVGAATKFTANVSDASRAAGRASLGDRVWFNVHHYCASISYLARAKSLADPNRRSGALRDALNEALYSFVRVPVDSPMYALMAANLASIHYESGRVEDAEHQLKAAIEAAPGDPRLNVSLAILYRKEKRLPDARATLEQALSKTSQPSMEVHYNLGLVCLELKDVECAVRNAEIVYRAGYPLPGLKSRLQALGQWPTDNPSGTAR